MAQTDAHQSYVFDLENEAESARLLHQNSLINAITGGLIPETVHLPYNARVLDVACGPGGWGLDMARANPSVEVVGVDLSQLMIADAGMQAWAEGIRNVTFRVMDVLASPLGFPDDTFDFILIRLISTFMKPSDWPRLLRECRRVLRPGGSIQLLEAEWGTTSSFAFERIGTLFIRAYHLTGRNFSTEGRNIGITPRLKYLLKGAGFQDMKQQAHFIDFSADQRLHEDIYQDILVAFKLVQPFLINAGVTTQEEIESLYQRVLLEMRQDDFSGIGSLLSVWGQKFRTPL